mmetsp:Transcript_5085/g.11200  ORF Transcript_5085/g.11200 Transcript_5085/m.11200 type:complete len:317 (+) Transcript_5085:241-1191(+)
MAPLEASLRHFHIVEELFRSNNGAVYKVRRKTGRKELLCLKERKFAELGRKRDIMNEVRLLEKANHPNVIKCFGHFWEVSSGSLFMVLEYVDGGDLYNMLLKRRTVRQFLSEDEIWSLFYQICLGVHHLHTNGIIHRDIKTLNIMLSKDMRTAKLADLGVSRQVSQDTLFLRTFYGTPLYASPELCQNKPYNEKTDIWSLGVVLYEMAALTPPFNAESIMGLAEAITKGEYRPMPSNYSDSLSNMVAQMLQVDPSKRPSMATLLSYFQQVSAGKGILRETTPDDRRHVLFIVSDGSCVPGRAKHTQQQTSASSRCT